jgi:hypothetical protein
MPKSEKHWPQWIFLRQFFSGRPSVDAKDRCTGFEATNWSMTVQSVISAKVSSPCCGLKCEESNTKSHWDSPSNQPAGGEIEDFSFESSFLEGLSCDRCY